jgi:hypothetical protein
VIYDRRCTESHTEGYDDKEQAGSGFFDLYRRVHAKKCDESHKEPKGDGPRSFPPNVFPPLRHNGAQLSVCRVSPYAFFKSSGSLAAFAAIATRLAEI